MASIKPRIMTINGGSSSIKFAPFEANESPQRVLGGTIERIGKPRATLETKGLDAADHASHAVNVPDHAAADDVLMDWIQQRLGCDVMAAVGHRVVRGGPNYSSPQVITEALIEDDAQVQSVLSTMQRQSISVRDELCGRAGRMVNQPRDLPKIMWFEVRKGSVAGRLPR